MGGQGMITKHMVGLQCKTLCSTPVPPAPQLHTSSSHWPRRRRPPLHSVTKGGRGAASESRRLSSRPPAVREWCHTQLCKVSWDTLKKQTGFRARHSEVEGRGGGVEVSTVTFVSKLQIIFVLWRRSQMKHLEMSMVSVCKDEHD